MHGFGAPTRQQSRKSITIHGIQQQTKSWFITLESEVFTILLRLLQRLSVSLDSRVKASDCVLAQRHMQRWALELRNRVDVLDELLGVAKQWGFTYDYH